MTLYDVFIKTINEHEDVAHAYEEYVEWHNKYISAIIVNGDICISPEHHPDSNITTKERDLTEKTLFKYTYYCRDNFRKNLKVILEKLNEKAPLDKIKSIHGYTEFDLLEWNLEKGKVKIKYKPKEVSVSFWEADAKHIIYE